MAVKAVADAEPGEIVSKEIRVKDNKVLLMREGLVLSVESISLLQAWGVDELEVKHESDDIPPLASSPEPAKPKQEVVVETPKVVEAVEPAKVAVKKEPVVEEKVTDETGHLSTDEEDGAQMPNKVIRGGVEVSLDEPPSGQVDNTVVFDYFKHADMEIELVSHLKSIYQDSADEVEGQES